LSVTSRGQATLRPSQRGTIGIWLTAWPANSSGHYPEFRAGHQGKWGLHPIDIRTNVLYNKFISRANRGFWPALLAGRANPIRQYPWSQIVTARIVRWKDDLPLCQANRGFFHEHSLTPIFAF